MEKKMVKVKEYEINAGGIFRFLVTSLCLCIYLELHSFSKH